MTVKFGLKIGVVALATNMAVTAFAQEAEVVYDNTTTSLNQFVSRAGEIGDEFRPGGTNREMTRFDFQTFSQNLDGDEEVTLRFYEITDPSVDNFTVGDLLFEQAGINLSEGSQVHIVSGISVDLRPVNLWTIEVSNLDIDDVAGLVVFDGPTVGRSFDDFVLRDEGAADFELAQIGLAAPANFAARVTAVPEPSTIALGALGLLTILGFRRRNS